MEREVINLILKNLLKDDREKKIHISLKTRRFYNGNVVSYDNDDMLEFNDKFLGVIFVPYDIIINIEPQKER